MEKTIIEQLLWNGPYFTKVWPYLNEDVFKNCSNVGYQKLYELIKDHYDKYSDVPTKTALKVALDSKTLSQAVYDFTFDALEGLHILQDEDPTWLLDKTEEYVRNNAIFNATNEVIRIQDNAAKEPDKRDKRIPDVGVIPDLLRDAISISFDTNIGHDWMDDYEERWKSYQTQAHKIPSGIKVLDDVMNGGGEIGTLNIILAGVGVGKSLGLIALSAAYLTTGLNVLYVSLEMSENVVAKRLDAALLEIDLDDLNGNTIPFDLFKSKMTNLKAKSKLGRFKVKQYPTGAANANTIRTLLRELKMKDNFVPDVIMLDYLGICSSFRIRTFTENSYTLVKAVAEEFRGLAVETGTMIWTGAQTTRTAWGSGDIGMEDTAESAGLPATADFMLGVIETEQMAAEGVQVFKQIKSRYGDKNVRLRFPMAVNKQRQTWSHIEQDSANKIITENGFTSAPVNQTVSQVSKEKIKDIAKNVKF